MNPSATAAAQDLVSKINDVFLFPLIALLSAIAFVVFLYGAFEYVKNSANQEGRQTGQRHLLYGVIGLLVMFSAFTILQIAAGTFGLAVNQGSSETTILPGPGSPGFRAPDPITSPNVPIQPGPGSPGFEDPTVDNNQNQASRSLIELQQQVIADYENNTNIAEVYYMADVRRLTTDIEGVDRINEINLAAYLGYISTETKDMLLQAAETDMYSSANTETQPGPGSPGFTQQAPDTFSNDLGGGFGTGLGDESSGLTGSGIDDNSGFDSDTPGLTAPSDRDTDVVPGGLINPNPNPEDTVVDTSSANPDYPVIKTWTNGTKEISCNNETGCTGAITSCTSNDHYGVYTGVMGYNDDSGLYILCQQ